MPRWERAPELLSCNAQTKSFIITGVFTDYGYVNFLDADQDGSPFLGDFGQDCTGTNIGQPGRSGGPCQRGNNPVLCNIAARQITTTKILRKYVVLLGGRGNS
jgi:hypothetical protein